MKIPLILLFILGTIYLSPVVYAQKDASYVVLSQGDTLYGKIKTDVSGHAKLKFENSKKKLVRINPDQF